MYLFNIYQNLSPIKAISGEVMIVYDSFLWCNDFQMKNFHFFPGPLFWAVLHFPTMSWFFDLPKPYKW